MKKTARTCNCNWNKSLQLLLWILNINLLNAFTKESIAICNIITSEVFLFLFFFKKKKKKKKKKNHKSISNFEFLSLQNKRRFRKDRIQFNRSPRFNNIKWRSEQKKKERKEKEMRELIKWKHVNRKYIPSLTNRDKSSFLSTYLAFPRPTDDNRSRSFHDKLARLIEKYFVRRVTRERERNWKTFR